MQSVLIVENDTQLCSLLEDVARGKGCLVSGVSTIDEAIALIDSQQFSAIILDRILDDGDGLEILQYLADCEIATPVLILSQQNSVQDRVAGLELGAVEYIGKPFSLAEFSLRLAHVLETHAHSHPATVSTDEIITAGPVTLHITTGELTSSTHLGSVILRYREAQILGQLLKQATAIISRDALIFSVWESQGKNTPSYSTIDVYIRRIRMATASFFTIQCVRGVGYRLVF